MIQTRNKVVLIGCALLTVVFAAAPAHGHRALPLHLPDSLVDGPKLPMDEIEPPSVPGELLVRFKSGVGRERTQHVLQSHGAMRARELAAFDVHKVKLRPGVTVAEAAEDLNDNPLVKEAIPNYELSPAESIPDDTDFSGLWSLRNVGQEHPTPLGNTKTGTPDGDADVADAWDATTGSPETVIAVLDDGVDIAHPDLAANIWTNDGEVPGNGVDDDGNGYADDVHGWDFGRNDANPSPDPGGGHGTHVAGIIAAVANNGQGIAGACPGCRIMPLKFAFDTASEIEAIAYAIANGADVVNMSYGQTNVWIPAEHRAIAALGRAGILVVASAANSNGDNDMYLKADVDGDGRFDYDSPGFPASYGLSNIVSVAASNDEDKLGYSSDCALLRGSPEFPCTFTNYGRESVDLAAPGVDILSTFPGGYEVWDGTSMAAPLVAGTAGLVKSLHPEYSPSQLRGALMNGAEVKETLSHLHAFPGLDIRGSFTRTNGRLNALSALTAATAVPPINDGSPKGARSLLRSARGTLSWPGDDNDFFKKRLRGGHAYKVVLDGPSGEDFDLVVWKPATMDVWQLEPGCFNGGRCPLKKAASTKASDESVRFRVPRSGAYYFQATSFLSRGHYTIKIKRVS